MLVDGRGMEWRDEKKNSNDSTRKFLYQNIPETDDKGLGSM